MIYEHFCENDEMKIYTRSVIAVEGIYSFGALNIRRALKSETVHIHPDSFEIFYLTRGELTVRVKDDTFHLQCGNALIIPPGTPHALGDISVEMHEGFFVGVRNSGCVMGLSDDWSRDLLSELSKTTGRLLVLKNDMGAVLLDAAKGIASNEIHKSRKAASDLLYFMYAVIEAGRQNAEQSISPAIKKAVDYINRHIRENPSLEMLCKMCGLSMSGFKHRFSAEVGMAPMEYINRRRIEEAKKMLEAGMSVTQTANELDFSSSNYFSVVFRKVTSMTASEYREKRVPYGVRENTIGRG